MATRKDRIWDKSARKCLVCGEEYLPVRRVQKFCPPPKRCRYTAKARNLSKALYVPLNTCTVCGREYVPRASNQITCGTYCPGKPLFQKVCANAFCRKTFIVQREVSPNRQIFCSRECNKKEEVFRKYGMTSQDYVKMLDRQGGLCLGCGGPAGEQRLVVDHDHSCCPGQRTCGKCVRGLMHLECNIVEGMFKDDPKRLLELAQHMLSKP